jgi:DASH complex subunit DAM1
MPGPPSTPLRRVSHGSLFALARSQSLRRSAHGVDDLRSDDPTAPADLVFLAPALSELADEADALLANSKRSAHTADTLRRFNEGFAAYMYALDMNGLTTAWSNVCVGADGELGGT